MARCLVARSISGANCWTLRDNVRASLFGLANEVRAERSTGLVQSFRGATAWWRARNP
jgi:hypothetical protein